jgi:hypothetical protein
MLVYNGGSKNPSAANKRTFHSSLASGFADTPQNGRVDVTTSINGTPVSADGFSCPSGQRLVLASVLYSGITLTDITNSVSNREVPVKSEAQPGITLPDVSRILLEHLTRRVLFRRDGKLRPFLSNLQQNYLKLLYAVPPRKQLPQIAITHFGDAALRRTFT